MKVDPQWDDQGLSVSAANDVLRRQLGMYLGFCFGDRPDLLAKVMPNYPPAAKRIVRDNGIWATTLKRDNVQLINDPIAAIEPAGLRMSDGTEQSTSTSSSTERASRHRSSSRR